jgi:hypothetical protein
MNLMTKTQLMDLVAAGKIHESFEHSDEGHFDVTSMRQWAAANKAPIVSFSLAGMVEPLRAGRVVDEERVANLPLNSVLNDPAMVVVYNEEGQSRHLVIDGTHRILRRAKLGLRTFPAYLIDSIDIIRPDTTKFVRGVDRGLDWGDGVEGDKIVKRDEAPLKNFWVSWVALPEQGEFELHSPWWYTGWSETGKSICAAVKATDADAARIMVFESYDKPPFKIDWRFVEERPDDWSPFSDRFPRAEWMKW